jgi:hypothetical protein
MQTTYICIWRGKEGASGATGSIVRRSYRAMVEMPEFVVDV